MQAPAPRPRPSMLGALRRAPQGEADSMRKPDCHPLHNPPRMAQHARGRSPVRSEINNRTASMDADSPGSESMRKRKQGGLPLEQDFVAGNGLLHRRALLSGGIVFAGALTTGVASTGAAAEPLKDPQWSLQPGEVTPVLQTPSRFEKTVTRILSNPKGEARTQHARAPLHLLDGTITPNPLHFTILHSGIPDIDPAQHRFVIHGMVKQPLEYTVEALLR